MFGCLIDLIKEEMVEDVDTRDRLTEILLEIPIKHFKKSAGFLGFVCSI